MSKSSTLRTLKLLFVFVVSVALVGADLVVLAQDSNTGTTATQDNMSAGNMNMGGGTRRRRRRRARRRAAASMSGDMSGNTNANLSPDMQNTNTGDTADQGNMMSNSAGTGMGGGRRRRRGRRRSAAAAAGDTTGDMGGNTAASTSASGAGMTARRYGRCDNTQQEQTDLSGTYSGRVNYEAGGLSGPATLTITGNNFTLDAGGQNISGRVVATTTCGYTAAAMMLGQPTTSTPGQPAPQPPTTVSVRVRRTGAGINLTPVGSPAFSFTSGGGGGGGRRRRRGGGYGAAGNMAVGPVSDTGNANMAGDASGNPNMDTGGNMNMGGGRRRRRGRRRANMSGDNMNMSGDMGGNSNMSGGDMSGNANMSGGDMSGNMNGNMNMRRPSRRRRGRRGGTTNTNTGGDMGNMNMGGNSNQ